MNNIDEKVIELFRRISKINDTKVINIINDNEIINLDDDDDDDVNMEIEIDNNLEFNLYQLNGKELDDFINECNDLFK